jgi:hypothetical protein
MPVRGGHTGQQAADRLLAQLLPTSTATRHCRGCHNARRFAGRGRLLPEKGLLRFMANALAATWF